MNCSQLAFQTTICRSNQSVAERKSRPLTLETVTFVTLNIFDVMLTVWLLETGSFYESNPIANFFLARWGMFGMTAYKIVSLAAILLTVTGIAVSQRQTARAVLILGSLVFAAVVLYSSALLVSFHWSV